MAKFCVNCGSELAAKDKVCGNCGAPVEEVVEDAPPVVVENSKPSNNATTVIVEGKKSNGLAIAGFVVSLVSSLLCCGAFNLIGLILSIIGLVKSKELDGSGKGMAIAGIIIACIFMIIGIVLAVVGTSASFIENLVYSY